MSHARVAPDGLDQWREVFRVLEFAEIWQLYRRFVEEQKPVFGPGVGERMAETARITPAEVEAAIIASAREELAGTTIMDYYDSGARADFGNHFKNMVLMRGLVADPENPGKFVVATGNLAEGTPKAEMVQGANLLLAGAGGRALQTRISGL